MPLAKSDLLAALASLTLDETQRVREAIAPITRGQRLSATADTLADKIRDRYNAETAALDAARAQVAAGDYDAAEAAIDSIAKGAA